MMALSISALFDAGSAAHTWGPGAVKPMPLDCVLVAGESGSAAPGYTGSWSMSAPLPAGSALVAVTTAVVVAPALVETPACLA